LLRLSLRHPPLNPRGTSVEECFIEFLVHIAEGIKVEFSFTTQFVDNDMTTHGLKDIWNIVYSRIEYRGHFPCGLITIAREMKGHFGFDGILKLAERASGKKKLQRFFVET
jgi:hypothetical protein